jgi:hypothetical protein
MNSTHTLPRRENPSSDVLARLAAERLPGEAAGRCSYCECAVTALAGTLRLLDRSRGELVALSHAHTGPACAACLRVPCSQPVAA